jgi:hypothetical protein
VNGGGEDFSQFFADAPQSFAKELFTAANPDPQMTFQTNV